MTCKIYQLINVHVTLHVSVWVEIQRGRSVANPTSSRSTWACELKWSVSTNTLIQLRHAPRERVSWNIRITVKHCYSVKSRSTWACELKLTSPIVLLMTQKVTLHVSVWVEIKIVIYKQLQQEVTLHVSVWVEICVWHWNVIVLWRHAPRERVSWNIFNNIFIF